MISEKAASVGEPHPPLPPLRSETPIYIFKSAALLLFGCVVGILTVHIAGADRG